MKRKKEIIRAVISGIGFGIAATAIWELFLRKPCSALIGKIVMLPTAISTFFGDWYASKVAFANDSYIPVGTRALIVGIILLAVIFGFDFKIIKKLPAKFYVLVVFIAYVFLFDMCIDVQINNDSHRFLRNIEIVSPYVTDQEYKQLKSDFYSIDTITDYHDLSDQLDKIAESNNIKLK